MSKAGTTPRRRTLRALLVLGAAMGVALAGPAGAQQQGQQLLAGERRRAAGEQFLARAGVQGQVLG